MPDWVNEIASERMEVDAAFTERVRESDLTNQQWGLVMTAVEFEIANPDDPERARIVANTDRLDSVIDEVRAAGDAGPGGGPDASGGGLGGRIKRALGLSEGGDPLRETAETLADEYANRLQQTLVEKGKWGRIRQQAAQ